MASLISTSPSYFHLLQRLHNVGFPATYHATGGQINPVIQGRANLIMTLSHSMWVASVCFFAMNSKYVRWFLSDEIVSDELTRMVMCSTSRMWFQCSPHSWTGWPHEIYIIDSQLAMRWSFFKASHPNWLQNNSGYALLFVRNLYLTKNLIDGVISHWGSLTTGVIFGNPNHPITSQFFVAFANLTGVLHLCSVLGGSFRCWSNTINLV